VSAHDLRMCGKATDRGCGRHVEQVLAGVPRSQRCTCDRTRARPAGPFRPMPYSASQSDVRRPGLRSVLQSSAALVRTSLPVR
jgi:hypothetical protein